MCLTLYNYLLLAEFALITSNESPVYKFHNVSKIEKSVRENNRCGRKTTLVWICGGVLFHHDNRMFGILQICACEFRLKWFNYKCEFGLGCGEARWWFHCWADYWTRNAQRIWFDCRLQVCCWCFWTFCKNDRCL